MLTVGSSYYSVLPCGLRGWHLGWPWQMASFICTGEAKIRIVAVNTTSPLLFQDNLRLKLCCSSWVPHPCQRKRSVQCSLLPGIQQTNYTLPLSKRICPVFACQMLTVTGCWVTTPWVCLSPGKQAASGKLPVWLSYLLCMLAPQSLGKVSQSLISVWLFAQWLIQSLNQWGTLIYFLDETSKLCSLWK